MTGYNFPFLSPQFFLSDLIWEQDREKISRPGKDIESGKSPAIKCDKQSHLKLKNIYLQPLFKKKKMYKSSLLPLSTLEKPWFI